MLSTAVLWQSLYYARFSWYRQIDAMYNHFEYEEEGAVEPDHPVLKYRDIVLETIEYISTYEDMLMNSLKLAVCQVMCVRATIDASRMVFKHLLDALYPEKKCKRSHATWFGLELPDGKLCCIACDEACFQVMHRTMCRLHPNMWPVANITPEHDKLPVDILECHPSFVFFSNERSAQGATFFNCLTGELMVQYLDSQAYANSYT
jgi:hypothetical protein